MTSILQIIRQFFAMFRWWVVIMPWEQAVRVRLGKNARVLRGGVHWRVPIMHAVYKQSCRLRAMSLPTQTISSRDGKTITLSASCGFSISDILKLYQTLHNADSTIGQLIEIAIATYVTTHDFHECLPPMICDAAIREVNLSRYGLGEIRLSINSFAVVKTFRIINDQRWAITSSLDTSEQDTAVPQGRGPA